MDTEAVSVRQHRTYQTSEAKPISLTGREQQTNQHTFLLLLQTYKLLHWPTFSPFWPWKVQEKVTKINANIGNHLYSATELFLSRRPMSHAGTHLRAPGGTRALRLEQLVWAFSGSVQQRGLKVWNEGGRDSLKTGRACRDTSHKIRTRLWCEVEDTDAWAVITCSLDTFPKNGASATLWVKHFPLLPRLWIQRGAPGCRGCW